MKHHIFAGITCAAVTACCIQLTAMPAAASDIDESEIVFSSAEGSIAWEGLTDGTLIISGQGRMYDSCTTPVEDYNHNSGQTYIPKRVIVEPGITHIGTNTFYSGEDLSEGTFSELTSVSLPEGLESIGSCAFYGCTKLTEITIPESVQYFGYAAFSGTPWYTEQKQPDGSVILNDVLLACPDAQTVTVPDGVIRIASHAVPYPQVQRIELPDSVKRLDDHAFADAEHLAEIEFPEHLTDIGYAAFAGTKWLTDRRAENPCVTVNHVLTDGRACTGDIVIPEEVQRIAPCAFASSPALTGVTIPDTVKEIGVGAFLQCRELKRITFPEGIARIPDITCLQCSALTDIHFPDSLREIGIGAFTECSSLTDVSLPETVTTVSFAAFGICGSLKHAAVLNPYCNIIGRRTAFCNDFIIDLDHEVPVSDIYSGTISGYSGSTAEIYAEEEGYTFESLGAVPDKTFLRPLIRGDVDQTQGIDVADAVLLARYLTEDREAEISQNGLVCADADYSGAVDAADVTNILLRIAKRLPDIDEYVMEKQAQTLDDIYMWLHID